ncbi:MAG: Na+/H+ antiporter NhaC family protein [Oscillibacter sp.]|jgi:Na+/H+ antiporter NhaC|nr:Na+/H+ antiporter NhaC family protein [Oscillibacter sp.]
MENNLQKKSSGAALIPFLVFIVIYLGAGLILQAQGVEMAFYQFPSVTAMFIAVLVAFCMGKGSINEKFSIFAKGAANENVLTMLIIYILAGAFSSVAAAMGGRDATVNMGLSLVPVQFLAAGIFVIAAFMGTATGTSMGTVSAIIPIAVGVADKGGLSLPLVVGACVGGAMFGDNLSMISDTTIAATKTQGCEMRDKFKVNFLIALPAAIVTIIVLLVAGRPETVTAIGDLSYNFVKIIPYLAVFILALVGMNVFLVLTIGIFTAGIIGMATSSLGLFDFAQAIWSGFTGMNEVFFLTLFCGGMAELIAHNGGIAWLIEKLRHMMKGNKSAQIGIAALVSLVDCATANNTVAIVVSGNVARDMSHEYKVDPRRTASLLDIFSCILQGVIPYGAQLLVAASLTTAYGIAMSPAEIVPYMWYCWILAIFGILSVFVPFADGVCRKNPWNWEYDVAESGVEAKKAAMAAAQAAERPISNVDVEA